MPLEAFLLTWVDDVFPITKCFPQDYSNGKIISELLIITKNFIDCGKGILQHKKKVFYYRTYISSNSSEDESSSKKSSFTDFFIYSSNSPIKKVFLLFLCDINYKKKNIDNLTKKIFEILDEGAFIKQDLKKESSRKINFLFEQYKSPETNKDKFIQLKDIKKENNDEIKEINTNSNNLINNNNVIIKNDISKSENNDLISEKFINNNNNDNNTDSNNSSSRKRNSRIIWSKLNNTKSQIGSIDINDLTSIKDSEDDLSIIFKQSLDEKLNMSQMKNLKTIKKVNIILCSILFIISLVLIILLYAL